MKRSWKAAYGKAPTVPELDELFRLIWVEELDLETGKRDRKAMLDRFARIFWKIRPRPAPHFLACIGLWRD